MKVFIETNRLLLREIVEADVEGMFKLDSNPNVHEFLGKQPITTLQESKDAIAYIRNQYTKNGIGRWAVIDKKTNDFIGWSGLKYETEVRKDFNYYDIGYRLREEYWGKGIATETAKASIKYGFEVLKLDEICGGAEIDNIASNKILSNVGLKFIEVFEYDSMPHNWYSLKRSEYKV